MLDLDGTLVDTIGDFDVAINTMLRALDRPAIPRQTLVQLVGKGVDQLIRQSLALSDPDENRNHAQLQAAHAHYQQAYSRNNGRYSTVFDGVQAALHDLKAKGLRLACVTNKPLADAQTLLQQKQLNGYFELVLGGDSLARKKPDPLPLLEACRMLGVAPHEALMVGDSSNDAEAAQAADMPVVLMTYGYNHGRPVREIPADAYLDDMQDLLPSLENTQAG